MRDQLDVLDPFREQDEWLLVVLDACRHDTIDAYLDLEVEAIRSPATYTKEWMHAVWPGEYDVTYVSAVPFIGDTSFKQDYNGTDHFDRVVNAWDDGWDGSIRTVPPERVFGMARDVLEADKVVVHFVQPHYPYVGHPPMGHDADMPLEEFAQTVSDDDLHNAYWGNLNRVWGGGVRPLLHHVDRPVAITADHGDCLGENGLYGHGHDHAAVRTVPWIEW